LATKIPLISTEEWRKAASKLHFQYPNTYRKKEAAVMYELAAKKAVQMYFDEDKMKNSQTS